MGWTSSSKLTRFSPGSAAGSPADKLVAKTAIRPVIQGRTPQKTRIGGSGKRGGISNRSSPQIVIAAEFGSQAVLAFRGLSAVRGIFLNRKTQRSHCATNGQD